MKILFAGDTHGNLSHCRYLFGIALGRDVDHVFILGDFGYWEHTREGVEFLDKLDTLATNNDIRVYFLDGNHDNVNLLLEKYDGVEYLNPDGSIQIRSRITYMPRGLRWTWDGVRFIALGGAYSVDKEWRLAMERKGKRKPGTLWFPGEEMTDKEFMAILDDDSSPVDVILAHDKPLNSNPMWNRKNITECMPNQIRLQHAIDMLHPSLFLHGHLHYRYTDLPPTLQGFTVTVEGLGADPDAEWTGRYRASDSWIIVDTEEFRRAEGHHQVSAGPPSPEAAPDGARPEQDQGDVREPDPVPEPA